MICLLASLQHCAAQFVQISGEIVLTNDRGSTTNEAARLSRTISFVCITGTNQWSIESDFMSGGESKWLFDETNVFMSLRGVGSQSPTINIWESRNGHPMGDAIANLTWLAFCSGVYLERAGRLVPLPLDDLHHTPDRFAYLDKTEMLQKECGLPRKVDLFLSRSLYPSSVDDFEKEWMSSRCFKDYPLNVVYKLPEGALTFHYEVVEFTNFLGRTFPTKFEFFQNGRPYVQNGNTFWRGEGKIKSIRAATTLPSVFAAGRQHSVIDWRFRDEASRCNALLYSSTNAFATPTNDPALQEKFAKKVARVKQARSPAQP